jgi:putative endonuclease
LSPAIHAVDTATYSRGHQVANLLPIATHDTIINRGLMTVWYVYILRCADKTLYTGITTDVEHRVEAHNRGTASKYTSSRTPVILKYLEKSENRSEASKREHFIKQLSRVQKLALIEASSSSRRRA